MKKCYIVGAGECAPIPKPDSDTLVIAADGGYNTLLKYGIAPLLLIGDLDSISGEIPRDTELIRFKEKKDETDMHLAYLEGKRRGCTDFTLFGGTGGRLDHTLANLALLEFIAKNGDMARLIGKDEDIFLLREGTLTLSGNAGAYFSVFAYGGTARGVSISGAEYELEGAALTSDFPLGVSNRFCDTPATLSVKDGSLLIVKAK